MHAISNFLFFVFSSKWYSGFFCWTTRLPQEHYCPWVTVKIGILCGEKTIENSHSTMWWHSSAAQGTLSHWHSAQVGAHNHFLVCNELGSSAWYILIYKILLHVMCVYIFSLSSQLPASHYYLYILSRTSYHLLFSSSLLWDWKKKKVNKFVL